MQFWPGTASWAVMMCGLLLLYGTDTSGGVLPISFQSICISLAAVPSVHTVILASLLRTHKMNCHMQCWPDTASWAVITCGLLLLYSIDTPGGVLPISLQSICISLAAVCSVITVVLSSRPQTHRVICHMQCWPGTASWAVIMCGLLLLYGIDTPGGVLPRSLQGICISLAAAGSVTTIITTLAIKQVAYHLRTVVREPGPVNRMNLLGLVCYCSFLLQFLGYCKSAIQIANQQYRYKLQCRLLLGSACLDAL